jgi:hypothetical protein
MIRAPDPAAARALELVEALEMASLFRSPQRMVLLVEEEYRRTARHLYSDPGHDCEARKCAVRPLAATVYRLRSPAARAAAAGPPSASRALVPAAPAAAVLDDSILHVCLEDCLHAAHRNVCPLGPACPHAVTPSRDDTYVFRDLFVCPAYGAVHACGAYCARVRTRHHLGGCHVCPITHVVLGAHIDPHLYAAEAPATGGSSDTLMAVGHRGGGVTWEIARAAATHVQEACREQQNRALARRLVLELIASPQRQILEFEQCLDARCARFDNAVQIAKRYAAPRVPRLLAALNALRGAPRPPYFRKFRVRRALVAYFAAQAERAATLHNMAPLLPPDARRQIAANSARIRELLGVPPPPPPARTDPRRPLSGAAEDEEVEYVRPGLLRAADLASRAVCRVYATLRAFADEHNRSTGAAPFQPFESIVVHLLYCMRQGHYVPVEGRDAHAGAHVTVIPRMDLMAFLPPEDRIARFDLASSTQRNFAASNTDIMRWFHLMAKRGRLHDARLELSDLDEVRSAEGKNAH